jgi:hypothetical protein
MKIVKNSCFGGFGLSDEAYEKLIEYGIPVRKYEKEERNPETGLYDKKNPNNEGEVIFDRDLDDDGDKMSKSMRQLDGRYWDSFLDRHNRNHPLLVRVVEELGGGHRTGASGRFSDLQVVEIPDDIEYEIDEYDGLETIREKHRTW